MKSFKSSELEEELSTLVGTGAETNLPVRQTFELEARNCFSLRRMKAIWRTVLHVTAHEPINTEMKRILKEGLQLAFEWPNQRTIKVQWGTVNELTVLSLIEICILNDKGHNMDTAWEQENGI